MGVSHAKRGDKDWVSDHSLPPMVKAANAQAALACLSLLALERNGTMAKMPPALINSRWLSAAIYYKKIDQVLLCVGGGREKGIIGTIKGRVDYRCERSLNHVFVGGGKKSHQSGGDTCRTKIGTILCYRR